ncbi:hypothetical protein B0H10DRAFT_2190861 [Mycena sp. CBHHK59/15]|nr:hypothetical protein B0H10DRAFT_2190861 [Mycena sp. CBHHK59/15]
MPKLKCKACVGNLGSFAKKKVKLAESLSPSPEVSRSATPEGSVASLDEFTAPTFDQDSTVSSENSDLSEDLNDVPVFETENTLLSWLEVGKKRLKEIVDAVKHPDVKEKCRGQYYKTKLGGAPAPRTERLKRANEKKTVAAHGAGLMSWLKKSAQDELAANGVETSQTAASASADDHDAPIASSSSRRPVTLEEVDDEESIHRPESPSPSERSRLEEDGLVDWEEIFASVSATLPEQSDLPSTPSTSAASGPLPTP